MPAFPVYLNLYDLASQVVICCGLFHTGVEVGRLEYAFSAGLGILSHLPREAPDGNFREQILLGHIDSYRKLDHAIDKLRQEFNGESYSLIYHNCNDFSDRLCQELLNRRIPGYVNRLARIGRKRFFSCCIPRALRSPESLADAPGSQPLLASAQPVFGGQGRVLSSRSLQLAVDSVNARELRAQAAARRVDTAE
eukprot:GEMP01064602.1.p1 GENE.GEMP01064602.1~~GEMP01064602.1.p1  ORF type:complete len:195 (+),score=21.67 GEMP01064602.1:99-683(+)